MCDGLCEKLDIIIGTLVRHPCPKVRAFEYRFVRRMTVVQMFQDLGYFFFRGRR